MKPLHSILSVIAVTTLISCGTAPNTTEEVQNSKPATSNNPITVTTAGKVAGYKEDDVLVFKGIRYGADTATTRFAAPAKPTPWLDSLDTKAYGDSCPQPPSGNPGGLFTSWRPIPEPGMSEDCLFLNVWTRGLSDNQSRPVMVWFHGGGFSTGSGSSAAYDGKRLAERGDVVVVTVNHRLNVFGYTSLEHYGNEFNDAPVAGVLDMIQALEWVQDNIKAFGGDPDSVMIFGESGGGAKVSTLMTSDLAKGLFHKAVIQSGALLQFPEKTAVQRSADKLVANLGLSKDNIQEIKQLPMAEILKAMAGTGAGAAPSLDGRVLTRQPFEADADTSKQIPLMLGTNRTENSLFIGARAPATFELDWEGLAAALKRGYPNQDVEKIIAGYRALQPNSNPSDIYFEATTDARWLRGHVMQAERKLAQNGAPVWLYLFDWDTPVDGGKWRSPHALEIGFVFDNVEKSASMSGVGPEQQRVADMMADTWISFARRGNPNNAAIPNWPAYDLNDRHVMVLNTEPKLVKDARRAQMELIDDSESYLGRYRRP